MFLAVFFLPLLGAIVAGLFGRLIGDRTSQLVTSGLLCVCAILSLFIFNDVAINGNLRDVALFSWIDSGGFHDNWSLRFDTLTVVMIFVVTWISAVVHVYSIGYMEHDESIPRFFSYLSLFTFAMLMLVTSSNLLQLFFGWEGVGVCSYLLIGFWYDRPSANAAAIAAGLLFGADLCVQGTACPVGGLMPGPRIRETYQLDASRVICCGICADACRYDALRCGPEFEFSEYQRDLPMLDILEMSDRERPTR